MRLRSRRQPEPDVTIGPLIDCVFLLLTFFLVATMYKKKDRDIDIVPPESSSAVKLPPDDDQCVIGINESGEVFWQGEAVSRTHLHAELASIASAHPEQRIRLDAHFETPFEKVVEMLDACKFRGLSNVGIRTYDDRYNAR
ncbi:biopolymer transport protein ExbD [Haloferula luteola]|uniref:Biopolymer transport protein ExbD n=1 Tax=Haloferula luteola TaxID=595692 RepID=A0A840VBK3_9BACT|nr:biopolymer transporter ExbD [Haloferula luteola]MBB5352058.1 biopolymer transport protein ExbD [Haloferula luteola]